MKMANKKKVTEEVAEVKDKEVKKPAAKKPVAKKEEEKETKRPAAKKTVNTEEEKTKTKKTTKKTAEEVVEKAQAKKTGKAATKKATVKEDEIGDVLKKAEANASDLTDEDKQRILMEKINLLVSTAKKNKNVIMDSDIVDTFGEYNYLLDADTMGKILSFFDEKKIDVLTIKPDEEEDLPDLDDEDDDFETDDDDDIDVEKLDLTVPDGINIEDPVRMYLKEIGKVQLLLADDEIKLAAAMENKDIAEALMKDFFVDDDPNRVITDEVLAEFYKLPPNASQEEIDLYESEKENKYNTFVGKNKSDMKRIIAGGEAAKQRLAEANLRLVVSIAKRYVGRGMLFLDLIQEGNLGLIKAVEKFDYRKGYKFSTYATWWIRQAITRAIADQARTIRIPVHMVETINKLIRVSRQLLQDLGREPAPDEIAKKMEIPEERVREILKISQEPVSLETPIGEEEDSHLGDFIQDDNVPVPSDAAAFTLLKEQLNDVLYTLTDREQKVLRLRFGLDDGRARTLEEVGKEFSVTRERIRQIEAKALRKLRHPSRSRKLKEFLE